MIEYQAVKDELKKRKESVKYFTKDFFETFLKERKENFKSVCAGNGVKMWQKTMESDMYNLTSGSYCEMLEIVYDLSPKFRIDYIDGSFESGFDLIERCIIDCDTEEEARAWAEATKSTKFYEVMRVQC